ncbi:MAG: AMMECR1 domain-containing protein [Spirochaetales bacterium]|nr:AMMECR1 domain-containing protein [Spirochaetales bacterium]
MPSRAHDVAPQRRPFAIFQLCPFLASVCLLAACAEPADLSALRQEFPEARLASLASAARDAAAALSGDALPPLLGMEPGASHGIGIRFSGADGDRGCVSFWKDVKAPELAVAATAALAARDPRYGDIARGEMAALRVEVNVYGEFRRIGSWREARPGIDTLMVVNADDPTLIQAGVALDEGWTASEYAEAVLRKAGLDPTRLDDDAKLGWRAAPTLRFVLRP